jgi:GT2 family glycosyltransferase
MLVSIITATFNSEANIVSNLSSIKAQTYPFIEHIIIDGASNDNTLSIIKNQSPSAKIFSDCCIYLSLIKLKTGRNVDVIFWLALLSSIGVMSFIKFNFFSFEILDRRL